MTPSLLTHRLFERPQLFHNPIYLSLPQGSNYSTVPILAFLKAAIKLVTSKYEFVQLTKTVTAIVPTFIMRELQKGPFQPK